jgi:hypothetical protein
VIEVTCRRSGWTWKMWSLMGALAVGVTTPLAARAAVDVGVIPATLTVSPGATFDIELDVTQAGSPFNGFDVVVGYDPAALTFVTNSQGCLMTGGCSAACGNTFHMFSAQADSLSITDILLCNQVFLTGPGQIYKLRFQASNTQQVTHVTLRHATFYNSGLYVTPVNTADETINIGSVGVGDGSLSANRFAVSAEPNPAIGPLALVIESGIAGDQRLDIYDTAGRLVRQVASGWQASGIRRVPWDGTDASGRRVPAGVYLVTLRSAGRVTHARVALLK